MKKKGRFVLEAALLVPEICLLIVYLVYFTLYAHDYAVAVHGVLESGVKGIYRDGSSDSQVEEDIQQDLSRKLSERLLWIQKPEVEVQVSPVKVVVSLSGEGPFLPVEGIYVKQELYRSCPSKTVRRSRWLKK